MAYWNPFGWSEETRRSIQSVVRPVMQVASMAASMGAFSGGGAAAAGAGAGSGAADPGAAPTLPEGVAPHTPGIQEWNTDMPIDAPGVFTPDPPPVTQGSMEFDPNPGIGKSFSDVDTLPQPVMPVPDNTTQLQPQLTEQQVNQNVAESYNTYRNNPTQENLDLYNDSLQKIDDFYNKDAVPIQQQPFTGQGGPGEDIRNLEVQQASDDPLVGQTVGERDSAWAEKNQPEIQRRMTEMNKATEGTQQPTQPAPKPKPTEPPKDKTEGPGPGGKEEKWSWDGKAFNWENIMKFLETPEGRKWLLIDEKGFAGIGRKLSAAADAGVSGTGGLTREERKKIYARLKKEREEKKRKRRRRK